MFQATSKYHDDVTLALLEYAVLGLTDYLGSSLPRATPLPLYERSIIYAFFPASTLVNAKQELRPLRRQPELSTDRPTDNITYLFYPHI
ncbi:hypothetical protein LZ554_000324 [Drepanopeziza brunnea f. sp. 'monogermtubi']|nr:hypothetical protein LZ554_000324 [Drepanopeziza brunnea f. sp. 'monogermtubi']